MSITTENLNVGLEQDQREKIVAKLSQILADQHVLYVELRNFHWNLRGPRFHSLHEFFEKLYTKLELDIDSTAERIRMIGGAAPGSMAEFLQVATLKESNGQLIDGNDAVEALMTDYEAGIVALRQAIPVMEEDYGDVGTADFLTELLQGYEEAAWMLRSQLGTPAA